MAKLEKLKNGIPKINIIFNKIITHREKLEQQLFSIYDIRYNDVENKFENRFKDETDWRDFNEFEVERVFAHNDIKLKTEDVIKIVKSGIITIYNPFSEYFEGLGKWNEKKDYIGELLKYIRAKEQPDFDIHFRKMLVRSIACTLEDGKFNKQAFILYNEKQSSGKSTFLRWLCPPALSRYFTEEISTDKDGAISLCENFFINLDELAGITRFELKQLKGFMARDFMKVRLPYASRTARISRRANFVGSTNEREFLTDITGSVRWLVFEITNIIFDYKKKINIDDVWRQAYYIYKYRKDYKYELTAAEMQENEIRNKEHSVTTLELELVVKHFTAGNKIQGELFTASEILDKLTQFTENKHKLSSVHIGRSLVQIGCEKETDNTGSYPVKKYRVIEK